jgi:hypothetical protein
VSSGESTCLKGHDVMARRTKVFLGHVVVDHLPESHPVGIMRLDVVAIQAKRSRKAELFGLDGI